MHPTIHQKCTVKELLALLDDVVLHWCNLDGEFGTADNYKTLHDVTESCVVAISRAKQILNREVTRVLVGPIPEEHGPLDVSRYIAHGPTVPLNRSLSTLARGGIDISLSAKAREEMATLLPAFANYAAWGAALIDKANPARAGVAAANSFLLYQTTYNANGDYTRLCQDAERAAAKARRR